MATFQSLSLKKYIGRKCVPSVFSAPLFHKWTAGQQSILFLCFLFFYVWFLLFLFLRHSSLKVRVSQHKAGIQDGVIKVSSVLSHICAPVNKCFILWAASASISLCCPFTILVSRGPTTFSQALLSLWTSDGLLAFLQTLILASLLIYASLPAWSQALTLASLLARCGLPPWMQDLTVACLSWKHKDFRCNWKTY